MFVNDNQINNFLTLENEFSNSNIDEDIVIESDQINEQETDISEESVTQMLHPTKFTKK